MNEQRDDQTEARLRRALATEAAMVQPTGDGLQKIRSEIDAEQATPWWRHPAVALVAAAAVGLAVGGLWFGLRDGDDSTGTIPPATGSSESGSPSPTASSPTPSETSTPPATATDDVFVYYVHDDGQAPRLYREEHHITAEVPSGIDPKAALGVTAMLAQDPADPDYASPWPAGTQLLDYRTDGDTATVVINRFVDRGQALNQIALQELVYTVTANDPAVKRINLHFESNDLTGAFTNPLRRAPMVDVQGLIWLLAPTQGAKVGSPVSIDGFGTAFEGTISWEVRKRGVVVKQGHTQGGSNGEFGEFHDTVSLPPGHYELSAYESSAEDGSPIHVDTKSFTVR